MQQAIILPDFEPTNGACIIGQEADGFGLVVNIDVVVFSNVVKHVLDDCIAAAFGEHKVLVGVELEKHVRFVVMDEFHTVLLEPASGNRCFLSELLAVHFIGYAIAYSPHLFHPVLVCE